MSYRLDCGCDSDEESFSPFIETEKDYKALYTSICKELEEANREKERLIKRVEKSEGLIAELRDTCERLTKENKKLNLSITNSKTAKNGYKEEQLVCDDLNNNRELRSLARDLLPPDFDTCNKLKGNSKIDIQSEDGRFTAQVKKFKVKQFQQAARTKRTKFCEYIPVLKAFEPVFAGWLDHPNGKDRILLTEEFYTAKQLSDFVACLNENKEKIIMWIFLGCNPELSPEYFIGSEYAKEKGVNVRKGLLIYRIRDIIDSLLKEDFKIRKSGVVIALGNGVITLQRKGGGRSERRGSDLAAKIIISKLTAPCFEYIF